MSYTIRFTDNINNSPLVVNDGVSNTQTSLTFPGRNQRGYGIDIAENFLHLLENFASSSPGPSNPVKGQLWYDTTVGVNELKVYDGANGWKVIGINKDSTNNRPSTGNKGDLFVDTQSQQLYLWSGTGWVLVGPNFSNGVNSGIVPEIIKDTSNPAGEQVVLKAYVKNTTTGKAEIVAILSLGDTVNSANANQPFTPRETIDGFTKIYPGLNIRNTTNNKIWGVSEKAENLVNGSDVIPASNVMRTDVRNATDYDVLIRNDSGVTIGSDSTGQLKLQVISGKGVLSHPTSAIEFWINSGTQVKSLVRLDPSNFSVGIDNASPSRKLDVGGTGRYSGKLEVTDTTDIDVEATITSTSNDQSALNVYGGGVFKKQLRVGDDLTVDGQIYLNHSNGSAVLPGGTNVDIGSQSKPFRYTYSNNFYGTFYGDIHGDVVGGNSESTSRLQQTTTFIMTGDVLSDGITFDGATGGFTKNFVTSIANDFINSKVVTYNSADTDFVLVYRPDDGVTYKTDKTTFLQDAATVPVGAIFPFAGTTVPANYLLCDGSEKSTALYKKLFDVIGYKYGDPANLRGYNTFKLPDLRGRFPLGVNNMDNGADEIPQKYGDHSLIDAGGGTLSSSEKINRVNDANASTVGGASGAEDITLNSNNIPASSTTVASGSGTTALKSDATLSAVHVVNPYLAVNYIIYAGKSV
jgi:microcystin-dependent protein